MYRRMLGHTAVLALLTLSAVQPSLGHAADQPGPTVRRSLKNDLSPRLDAIARAFQPIKVKDAPEIQIPEIVVNGKEAGELSPAVPDLVLQDWKAEGLMPDPELSFEGLNNNDNQATIGSRPTPPDPNGDVGPNHYVQTLNLIFAVYDKAGTRLLGPLPNNAVFAGFGGPCQTRNDGDPIVRYDDLADRWLLSQFTTASPFHQCIAISQTSDPTGAWYRYDFIIPSGRFNDYPKFGVWPDGYYMSAGARGIPGPVTDVFAFERDRMLAGLSARMVSFQTATELGYVAPVPADLDGPLPPVGAPNVFVGVKQSSPQALLVFRFHVDWANPANSTFGLSGLPNDTLSAIAPFTLICPSTRSCIPQPGTTTGIDALAGRYVMYRAQYRNFGTYESIVFNQTVDAGAQRAGVRWYEIRDPAGTPLIHQQGTYAPGDGLHRWMGSAAMDRQGNLAIGFSVSSGTVFPSIHYAGRLVGDPPGLLAQGEAILQTGGGSQLSTGSRWGDYSVMGVDPSDDCTFWYTTEYYATTSTNGWQTRIGRFRYPGCLVSEFTPSADPSSLDVPAGGSGTSTITVQSVNGFSSPVSLSCATAPGITCSFSPPSVTPPPNGAATTTLTVSVAGAITRAEYSLLVVGTSSVMSRRAQMTIAVNGSSLGAGGGKPARLRGLGTGPARR
jgi:hypothetical protein